MQNARPLIAACSCHQLLLIEVLLLSRAKPRTERASLLVPDQDVWYSALHYSFRPKKKKKRENLKNSINLTLTGIKSVPMLPKVGI